MQDVPTIDATAIVALQSLVNKLQHDNVGLIMVGLPARLMVKLSRAGIKKQTGKLMYCRNLSHARDVALRWITPPAETPEQVALEVQPLSSVIVVRYRFAAGAMLSVSVSLMMV